MAEPTTVAAKVTAVALLAGYLGPIAAEYSFVLVGAAVGGVVSLSLLATPIASVARRFGHVASGVGVALFTTPMVAAIASNALPVAWSITGDVLLPGVALGTGIFWHRALSDWLPGWLGRKAASSGGDK